MLQDRDILQAASTLMAGALIFLSLLAVSPLDEKARGHIVGLSIMMFIPLALTFYFSLVDHPKIAAMTLMVSVTAVVGFIISFVYLE